MTSEGRLERDLSDLLVDQAMGPAPDYLDDVLYRSARTRQRPAWTFPERWLRSDIANGRSAVPISTGPLRVLGVLLLIGLLIAAAAVAYIGSAHRLPEPFGVARNGSVAFAQGGDIVLTDPVTGASRVIVADPAYDHDPIFSPDGTRLAIMRPASQVLGDDMVITDADGSHPVVISTAPLVDVTWTEWAPDGRTLAVASSIEGRPTFQLLDAQGGGVRTLFDDLQVDGAMFRPPYGTEILFRGRTADSVGLYVMNSDGSNRRTLIAPSPSNVLDYDFKSARYSPDGTRIAYHRWDPGLKVFQLHLMAADGTSDRVLAHDPGTWFEGWPAWSPDGTRIAIQRVFRDPSGAESSVDHPYAIVRVDGTGDVIETGPVLPDDGATIDWSPDGTKLIEVPASGDTTPLILDPGGGPWTRTVWSPTSYPSWQRLAP